MFGAALDSLGALLGPRLVLRSVTETDSTNSDLLEASRLDPRPQLLVAEHQRAGRGRLGRSWSSRAGDSLTFSLAWPVSAPLAGLSLAVGSCLADSLDPEGRALQLKWPNDLWHQQRKLGGILIETAAQGVVVVGVGLNLSAPAVDQPSAGLLELDSRWSAPLALQTVLPPLVELLHAWRGFDAARQRAFAARDGLLGRRLQAGAHEGVAAGVDRDGALCLRLADGSLQRVVAGELRLLEGSSS
jgi:BirA family biotin operon repressor/biotin-[acetyl-CoA-carboxylase] ligase